MQPIAEWLEKLGMSEYAQRFIENRIDLSVLPDLTDQDLEKLGVVLGDRRKMLRAIAKLDNAPAAAAPSPTSTATAPAERVSKPVAEAAGERRHVTVMFCDLVGFDRHCSPKLDAEEWRDLVGGYLDAASAAVTEMGGKVAKKLGDGLMALFGYPVAQENDAERAVRAALSIQRALAELNRKNEGTWKARARRAHRHRLRASGGRRDGRDFRRRAERRGAGAGAGRAGCGHGHGAGAAAGCRPVRG